MPTLNAYNNKPGYYILAAIDGNPITFQVTPGAGELLQKLGYNAGSELSWNVLYPLYEREEIYTHKTGVSEPEISTSNRGLSGLSTEQKELFEEYLEEEDETSSSLSLLNKDVYSAADEFLVSNQETTAILSSLPNRRGFAKSILHAKEIPFEVKNIEAKGHDLVYECQTSNGTRLILTDTRWNPDRNTDFNVVIRPEGEEVTDVDIVDGYLAKWDCAGKAYIDSESDLVDRHKQAYKKDKPRTGGLGYDPENHTELLQRLFVFIDYYDLRPDPRGGGHRKVVTQSELKDQHIWVTPRKTVTSTSKSDSFTIDSELVNITLRKVKPYTDVLIHIPENKKGNAKNEIVNIERGIVPSNN